MTYLEAQAAGLPVIAENHAAQRDIIAAPLAPVRNARAFADAIKRGAREREVLSGQARDHIVQKHSVSSAARTLRDQLMPLVS
jgi:glycosyltransferase involved in cell wall biosynthesis